MQAPFSPYLCSIAGGMRQLMERFYQDFDDVSILCTDSVGFAARVSRQVTTLSHETMTT